MLDLVELREYILIELGGGVVEVELTDEQMDAGIRKAIHLINRKLPGHGHGSINLSQGTKRYVIDQDKYPGFMDMLEVSFINSSEINVAHSVENPFAPAITDIDIEDAPSMELGIMYRQDAKKVFSAEPEWIGKWEIVNGERVYALYVDLPEYSTSYYLCGFEYAYAYTFDESPLTGVGTIPASLEQWVEDYAIAKAKIILGGRIRDKYKGIPTPDGSDLQIDGEQLLQEGINEKENLEDDLDLMQRQLPPLIE